MKSFKKSFYDLIGLYRRLPYLDEHIEIAKNGKNYRVKLEIEEAYYSKKKPTHKTAKSLIKYLRKNKDVDWRRCDDPANDPPLYCFSNFNDVNYKFCSISLRDLSSSNLSANQIMEIANVGVHGH